MKVSNDRLAPWAAYVFVGIGALVMLAPFYFMFVFATQSRTENFSLPPPIWFGDDFFNNLEILTKRIPFWRNLGWSVYVAVLSTVLTLLFCSIVLPLLKPALGTLGRITFIANWKNFIGPLIVMRSPEMYTLPLALRSLQSPVDTEWGALMTGSAIATLPLVILFILSSRQLIAGLTAAAVK